MLALLGGFLEGLASLLLPYDPLSYIPVLRYAESLKDTKSASPWGQL